MNPIHRRLALLASMALFAVASHAQTAWPAKPITLIVPFPPGGFTDNVSRAVSVELGKTLGQSVIIENRSGAGGRIGTDAILKAPKDSYTIGLGVPATLSLLPIIDPKYAQLAKQYSPITVAVKAYLGFAINPEKPRRAPSRSSLPTPKPTLTRWLTEHPAQAPATTCGQKSLQMLPASSHSTFLTVVKPRH